MDQKKNLSYQAVVSPGTEFDVVHCYRGLLAVSVAGRQEGEGVARQREGGSEMRLEESTRKFATSFSYLQKASKSMARVSICL